MCKSRWYSSMVVVATAVCLAGCGGAAPEPEAPEPEVESEPPPADDEPTEVDVESEEESEAKPEEPKKLEVSMQDIVTAPDTLYMFAFPRSEIKEVKEQQCEKKSGGEPEKKAQCMTKAQESIEAVGMRFYEDNAGDWYWAKFALKEGKFVDLNRIKFEFGAETRTQITLKLQGPDRGKKPMANVPAKLVLTAPDRYSLAVDDPTHGKMVYEAKVGLTDPE